MNFFFCGRWNCNDSSPLLLRGLLSLQTLAFFLLLKKEKTRETAWYGRLLLLVPFVALPCSESLWVGSTRGRSGTRELQESLLSDKAQSTTTVMHSWTVVYSKRMSPK
jgi:hypothetical protein